MNTSILKNKQREFLVYVLTNLKEDWYLPPDETYLTAKNGTRIAKASELLYDYIKEGYYHTSKRKLLNDLKSIYRKEYFLSSVQSGELLFAKSIDGAGAYIFVYDSFKENNLNYMIEYDLYYDRVAENNFMTIRDKEFRYATDEEKKLLKKQAEEFYKDKKMGYG